MHLVYIFIKYYTRLSFPRHVFVFTSMYFNYKLFWPRVFFIKFNTETNEKENSLFDGVKIRKKNRIFQLKNGSKRCRNSISKHRYFLHRRAPIDRHFFLSLLRAGIVLLARRRGISLHSCTMRRYKACLRSI